MTAELFEVEDRLVLRMIISPNAYAAWVWTDKGWRSAPGLTGKASSDGVSITAFEAARSFPNALTYVDGVAGVYTHFG